MRKYIFHFFLCLCFFLLFSTPLSVYSQSAEINTSVEYQFGKQITFQAQVISETPINTAIIFFQAINDNNTIVGLADITSSEDQKHEIQYTHQIPDYAIPSFSKIEYHFEITLMNDEILHSPTEFFFYEDNRFEWNTLEESPFKVHWYEGDLQFAQNILDTAQSGYEHIQRYLSLPAPLGLEIYVYADNFSMQGVLHPESEDWVAGHADPALGVIVIELPSSPDQTLLMKQRIPHELMHILLYQSAGAGYDNLPTWLNEGLATNAEIYPNPDYRIALKNAIEQGNLIPIASLCHTFPRNNSDALLSYAESNSFINYLYQKFGASGIEQLVITYANGVDCERGVELALGVDLAQAERNWHRQILPENSVDRWVDNLIPLVMLMAALFFAPSAVILHRVLKKKHS